MTVRRHEVETAVDAVVLDVSTIQPRLVGVELAKLTVDVVFDRLPAANEHQSHVHCTPMKRSHGLEVGWALGTA